MNAKRLLYLLPILCLLLSGCHDSKNSEPLSHTDLFFDTVVTIQLYDTTDEKILDHCFELCETYENKFSRTIATSEISQINQAAGTPVTVSDDTIELLKLGIEFGERSGGSFDITIAPVSSLWDFTNDTHVVPDASAIAEALKHVDYKNIQIEGNRVTLADPQAAVDLGGIAKGYIADQLRNYLEDVGVKHALINLGGNIVTIGGKSDDAPFHLGIQKPFDEKNQPIASVEATDCSLVSSGIYERYFELDEKRYHHILDAQTGYPVENDLLGVSIYSKSSAEGDAYSTLCVLLGLEQGLELIEATEGVEALFITADYELHYSSGFPDKTDFLM